MERLKDILVRFGISPYGSQFEQTEQGLINTTYYVSYGKQRRYVLQRLNENVFPNSSALFHNLERTLPHLSDPNYTQVQFHRTSGGELFYRAENQELWRLMSYLPRSKSYHHTSNEHVAFEAGRILGLFHSQLKNLDPGELKITLDKFHNLDWRIEQYHRALEKANVKDLQRTLDLQNNVEEIGDELSKLQAMDLPIRVCHNDTKLNNILFSEENKALCLIDLDTLMPGLLLYDFGDAVRTLANPAPEEETELSNIDFSIEMFAAFAEGMALYRSEFSPEEILSLSLGPVYMPFLHGVRAYADFLLGNLYYKVAYPDQNLDRARSLFHFARLAREHIPWMQKILQRKML